MKGFLCLSFFFLLFSSWGFSSPGDTISFFQLPGDPTPLYLQGLEKDPYDNNIWASDDVGGSLKYCKFDSFNHNIIIPWQQINDQYLYYTRDIGYPYFQNGVKNIVFVSESPQHHYVLVDPLTNTVSGYLPNTYSNPYNNRGCAISYPDDIVYISNLDINVIKKSNYPITSWSNFVNCSTEITGLASGWNKLFAIHWLPALPDVKIYQYRLSDGMFEKVIQITNWNSNDGVSGLSCGRENALGNQESLFIIGTYNGSHGIYEIEIDNLWPDSKVQPTSLGALKASFH